MIFSKVSVLVNAHDGYKGNIDKNLKKKYFITVKVWFLNVEFFFKEMSSLRRVGQPCKVEIRV